MLRLNRNLKTWGSIFCIGLLLLSEMASQYSILERNEEEIFSLVEFIEDKNYKVVCSLFHWSMPREFFEEEKTNFYYSFLEYSTICLDVIIPPPEKA